MKKEKGITLIALVVTIVVLLILAGVSISILSGDSGLIKKVQESRNKWGEAEKDDLDALETMNDKIENIVAGKIVAKKGSLLEMYRKAVKDNCTNSAGTCTNKEHLHIGDYVDYKNPTSGMTNITSAESGAYGIDSEGNATAEITQTYLLSETKNNVKWRVLGEDKISGGIKLIAADPVEREANENLIEADYEVIEDPYLYLQGAEGDLHGPGALNKISEMYLNSYATKARSVTIDDINEITGVTTPERIKEINLAVSDEWKQYGEVYNCKKQYTPELWLQNKQSNENKTTTVSGTINGYYYAVNYEDEISAEVTNERVWDMLFKGTGYETRGKAYWLASNGIYADLYYAGFGIGVVNTENGVSFVDSGYSLFYSYGEEDSYGFAVRPVVVLKTDVMAKDMPKIEDQESTWTYKLTVE